MEMMDWKPQIEERGTAWIQSGSLFTLGAILIKEHDLILYKVFPQYFQNCWMFPWTESNKEMFEQFLTKNLFSSFTRYVKVSLLISFIDACLIEKWPTLTFLYVHNIDNEGC